MITKIKTFYIEAVSKTSKIDTVYSANVRTANPEALKLKIEEAAGLDVVVSARREGMENKSFDSFVKAANYWKSDDWQSFRVDENGESFPVEAYDTDDHILEAMGH